MADKRLVELAESAGIDVDGRWGDARLLDEIAKAGATVPDDVMETLGDDPASVEPAAPPVPMPAAPEPAAKSDPDLEIPHPAASRANEADQEPAPDADDAPQAPAPAPAAVGKAGIYRAICLARGLHIAPEDIGKRGDTSVKFVLGDEIAFTNRALAEKLADEKRVKLV